MLVPLGLIPVIPAGRSEVQVKFVPAVLVKLTATEEDPEHIIWFEGVNVTAGEGFIVIVNVLETPGQPFTLGVTVMVATIGVVPLLIAVKAGIAPTPLAPIPIVGLVLLQL